MTCSERSSLPAARGAFGRLFASGGAAERSLRRSALQQDVHETRREGHLPEGQRRAEVGGAKRPGERAGEHEGAEHDQQVASHARLRSSAAGERLGGLAPATRAAAQALAGAFDVVVIETVGVGQAETEVAEVADTVAVVVQPGTGDVLQFLKAGIMETPDVLVVTKSDLGELATRTRRDLSAALRSLGSSSTPVIAVSSLNPPSGIEELIAALEAHRAGLDVGARRVAARRAAALTDFAAEHGELGLRALGGRRGAETLLAAQQPDLDVLALVQALERSLA